MRMATQLIQRKDNELFKNYPKDAPFLQRFWDEGGKRVGPLWAERKTQLNDGSWTTEPHFGIKLENGLEI